MGVDRVQVEPVLHVAAQPVLVELAHTEHERSVHAVDVVVVDVEHVGHGVVAADLLVLLEGAAHQLRVDQRDRGHARVGVGVELGDRLSHAGELVLLHRVDVVGRSRRRDVLLDVRRLLVGLGRLDLELLDDARPDQPEEDGGEDEESEPHRRQQPRAPPDVEEEQHRTDQGDAHQDRLGRQHRVVVGVGDAGEQRPGLVGQVVAVEPVVERLRQHEDAEQHRELGLRGPGEPVGRGLQPDPAVEVVDDGRGEQRDHADRHHEVGEEVVPGQVEDEEADVLVEVGVLALERHAVAPQHVVAPLPRARGAGEEAEQHADADDQPGADRRDGLAVAVEAGLLGRLRVEQRPHPERDDHVDRDRRPPSARRRSRTARSWSRAAGCRPPPKPMSRYQSTLV